MPTPTSDRHLFVVDITYTVELETINELLEAHVAFLEQHYAAGLFLASGPKVPRTGGVIIAQAESRAALAEVLSADPFQVAGVAELHITEFRVSAHAPNLDL